MPFFHSLSVQVHDIVHRKYDEHVRRQVISEKHYGRQGDEKKAVH